MQWAATAAETWLGDCGGVLVHRITRMLMASQRTHDHVLVLAHYVSLLPTLHRCGTELESFSMFLAFFMSFVTGVWLSELPTVAVPSYWANFYLISMVPGAFRVVEFQLRAAKTFAGAAWPLSILATSGWLMMS